MKKILIFFLVVFVLFLFAMIITNTLVPNDIGVSAGQLSELPSTPNAVSSQTTDESRYVEPLLFQGSFEESKEKLLLIINQHDEVTIITNDGAYLHVVFKSKMMNFKDDVEFFFDLDQGLIHFRSASRVGYSDMGKNLERYELIKSEYEK